MSDRKYRQRGYQDEPRERQPRAGKPAPPKERTPGGRPLQDASGPRTPNLMASHEVFRCARCGNLLPLSVDPTSRCGKCGVDLHACIQCASFDTSARWECTQNAKLPARVAPKDERNLCGHFAPRTTIERQTSSPTVQQESSGSSSARKAFDDLFK
jgi:hypothetical protein